MLSEIKDRIESIRGQPQNRQQRCESAIELAALMASEAARLSTEEEKRQKKQLARLVGDPAGKAFVVALVDQAFRSKDTARVADQLVYLIDNFGTLKFLSATEKIGLKLFRAFGRPFHRFLVPLLGRLLRRESSSVILDEERLEQHLARRRRQGVSINLNHLGEAILGEVEAKNRLDSYLNDLANPAITCVSIKISSLYSQINPLSKEQTLQVLGERLKQLYRAALPEKFVYLDMEEYRDLFLTVELFQDVLSAPEFQHLKAGLVLQSYLPDSFLVQQELTRWALKRMKQGGAPIKIRLVKGANLSMEQLEASLKGWPQAPYSSKKEADAQFKRMLEYGCRGENAKAVNLGIGSHNLFDIAYALLLRGEQEIEPYMDFEMLEGMADPLARVVKAISGDILLYCPVADTATFEYAIAYLVRRLDENTAVDNFLSDSFAIKPGTAAWERQENYFRASCEAIDRVSSHPRRVQNRLKNDIKLIDAFTNEPDTDWSLPQNREWAEGIVQEWRDKTREEIPKVTEIEPIVAMAQTVRIPPLAERVELLGQVAHLLRRYRGALIGVMAKETSKTIGEADVEVSEAIDFVEFYRRNVVEVQNLRDIRWHAKGVILVAPPWNFSCSIPVGGIAAALAAGNSVLFKPAPEAVWVGLQVAKLFWEAGIDPHLLQFVFCDDEPTGSALIQHPGVASVILTGATDTAKLFLKMRPRLDLMAETGGKNTLIISRMADRDQAIRDLIQSAFGYAGQKCSACSLAICEAEVYDDPKFRQTLKDAAESLPRGTPWNLATRLNPLIRPPGEALKQGLLQLLEGEEWLLKPRQDPENPLLWSPGIKLGVEKGSFTHQTEFFGPILGLMRASSLEDAISLANATPYGLTAGLHTLDEREKELWLSKIEAGNCYINRGITGAIVLRQPFGGCKASSFGPGAKAGGPNYVMQMMRAEQISLPEEREKVSKQEDPVLEASLNSYAFYWSHYFSRDHDIFKLPGQENKIRYVPRQNLHLWVQERDAPLDVARAQAAAVTCGAVLKVSREPSDLFANKIAQGAVIRLRCLSEPPEAVSKAAAQAGVTLIVSPILANGRLELLHYLREVSISHDTHRYGNLKFIK